MTPLLVALGGALGALTRYLLDRAVTARTARGASAARAADPAAPERPGDRGARPSRTTPPVPWGILAANLLGCLVLGGLTGARLGAAASALLATGFCGALTTYSTFAVDTVRLVQARRLAVAAAYSLGSLALGLAAFAAGEAAASALAG